MFTLCQYRHFAPIVWRLKSAPGNNSLSRLSMSPLWTRSTHTLYSRPTEVCLHWFLQANVLIKLPSRGTFLQALSSARAPLTLQGPKLSSAPPAPRPGGCPRPAAPGACARRTQPQFPSLTPLLLAFPWRLLRFEHEAHVSATSPIAVM